MASRILLLGHNKNYYGADTSAESIAAATQKAFSAAHHLSQGAAFLENLADCSVMIPAGQVQPFGAPFAKHISASTDASLLERIDRLVQELLVEADSHNADYVLIQSLEFSVGHFETGGVSAWAQMLIALS